MTRNRPPSHEEGQRMNLDTQEREGKQPYAAEQEDYAEGPARPPQEKSAGAKSSEAKTDTTPKHKQGRAS